MAALVIARFTLTFFLCLLASIATASPIRSIEVRQDASSQPPPYSLPNQSWENWASRVANIEYKQSGFTYGPGVGGGPFSPAGDLGQAAVGRDSIIYQQEGGAQLLVTRADNASAFASTDKYNGLRTLEDYTKLYDDEWVQSTSPTGVSPGLLTNYTQDLLFSMERLSFSPYAVRRLGNRDTLPFMVEEALVRNISGSSLHELHQSRRLFYVDHRDQSKYARATDGKYAAACDAYFYISKVSGDFLPLAIRTNANHSLIYTPQDSAEDWLLAKMMFNTDDFYMAQFHHLANTHYVAETAYLSAIRTLSDEHPVLAILNRIMLGTWGIRPIAAANLFASGAAVDRYFGYTGAAAALYAADIYRSGYAGAFQSNYYAKNLRRRGLINDTGPALKHFPFYEDALPIYTATRAFMQTFVDSYYPDSETMHQDNELMAWLEEASGPAQAIDFPTKTDLETPADFADLLTHIAHLSTSAHHAVNLNQLITGGGVLPFHPTAIYKPVPTAKGVADVAAYLPPLNKALGILSVEANFARPLLAGTNRSMAHMFDDEAMLSRLNAATRDGEVTFRKAMEACSEEVRNRKFDERGLSQGMPFLWKALDPETIPWSLSI